ncbi:MAG TPA: Xaa-Pro peptidase family protein [Steroidobacter sp.]
MKFSRRGFVSATLATGVAAAGVDSRVEGARTKIAGLASLTTAAKPITAQEHEARIAKLQALMQRAKVAALLVDAGSTLEYFTGVRWSRSERTTAALIPAAGRTVLVTPFFEAPSIAETLKINADVRPWKEDENPFELLAGALREQAAAQGELAVEDTTRFFITDRVLKAARNTRTVVPGEALVRACRMIKSPAELALMQVANDVTIAALRQVYSSIAVGMSGADVMNAMASATEALGGTHEFSSVLLNEASAFPHGSRQPQSVREGSVVLIDTGCTVHGYQSDITRTWVFGEPSPRQREVWDTVKRGQEIALETAKLGVPCGAIDKAVRAHYEQKGWRKDYGLPGLSHRTGHGIGLDGHESPYLVRNDATVLAAGMCFSDEPGIYIPGEFGVRLEDCWYMSEAGPKLFTRLARSLPDPI